MTDSYIAIKNSIKRIFENKSDIPSNCAVQTINKVPPNSVPVSPMERMQMESRYKKNITGTVVHATGRFVTLNVGYKHSIKIDDEFILYNLGDEIFDPNTNESLGLVEILCMTDDNSKAKVVSVQKHMCTIRLSSLWDVHNCYYELNHCKCDNKHHIKIMHTLAKKI